MTYKYTHFIPENIAPKGAVSIEVYNKENQLVTTIPLGRMTPPSTEPIYSFGLISDLHLTASTEPNYKSTKKVQKALRYFQDTECDFVIACGDLTNTGFFTIINNEEKNPDAYVYTEEHFAKYQSLCQEITIPVYAICGNHENYGDGYHGHKLSEYMTALTQYTGINSWFQTINHKGDSFVFLSQPDPGHIYSDDDMAAITTFLDDNLNKRIYIIIHTYIEEDSGDPGDYRENPISPSQANQLKKLLSNRKNVILMHGHSHMKFEMQQYYDSSKKGSAQDSYKATNFTEKNGFKSVHVPSISSPRYINFNDDKNPTPYDNDDSQGYRVDVYSDCLIFNGLNFGTPSSTDPPQPVPLGTFKIELTQT